MQKTDNDARESARRFFARPWIFAISVHSAADLPPDGPAEIAFAGRSNVGKSSLINALCEQKGLARTSNTPGRTQALNYFIPATGIANGNPQMAIVDMPGYGFARAPRAQVEAWTRLVFSYLRRRATLKRVFLLIDSRHGIKKNDEQVLDLLDKAAVSYQIVLTKADKPGGAALENIRNRTEEKVKRRPAAFPRVLAVSAATGSGIGELREEIHALVA